MADTTPPNIQLDAEGTPQVTEESQQSNMDHQQTVNPPTNTRAEQQNPETAALRTDLGEEQLQTTYQALLLTLSDLSQYCGELSIVIGKLQTQHREIQKLAAAGNTEASDKLERIVSKIQRHQKDLQDSREEAADLKATATEIQATLKTLVQGKETLELSQASSNSNLQFIRHTQENLTHQELPQINVRYQSLPPTQQTPITNSHYQPHHKPVPIPSNLPKFNSNNPNHRADQFLEKLELALDTAEVEKFRYVKILQLQCDPNTANWVKQNCANLPWEEARTKFTEHYFTKYDQQKYYLELFNSLP